MEGQELIDYLKNRYGNCEVMENGTLHVQICEMEYTDYYNNHLYFPPKIDGRTDVCAYIPGSGGQYNDAALLRERAESIEEGQLTYVLAISATSKDNYTLAQSITDDINNCGSRVEHLTYTGFSMGGPNCIERANEYALNNPDVEMDVVIAEGYFAETTTDFSTMTGLIDNDIQISMIGKQGYSLTVEEDSKKLTNGGLNVKVVTTNDSSHNAINAGMIKNIIPYITGEKDEIGTYMQLREPNYKYFQYNKETGQFDIEIEEEYLISNASFNFNRYQNDYKYDFSRLSNNKNNIGSYTKTDFTFLEGKLNEIRTSCMNTEILDKSVTIVEGSDEFKIIASKIIGSYIDTSTEIIKSVLLQTDSAYSVGQSILDEDIYLSHKGNSDSF